MAYFDAAQDRVTRESRVQFEQAVESVRIGYIVARDAKANRLWQRQRAKASGRKVGLTGAALETAVMAFAMTNPDLVQFQQEPA